VEASALTHASALPGLRGPSALLRLQSDERLIALTRRGNHAAFEILCSRYHSRLLSFCRHMLASREDAEDVLQEVFAAAFNAVLADEREINVRPWLYRIARNRSLNHLRRATAVGVDSMDVHFADHGLSTSDRAIRRESFRELLSDVHKLPETQRTALLLREIDALSYEQIAQAMETTVPSVKSLLVRARISLAEAAEARRLSCEEVRHELGEAAEGLAKLSAPARRHVRGCERCRFFKKHLRQNNHALAAMLPVGPLVLAKKLIFAKLTASASSAHVAGGAGATVGAGAVASAGAASAGSTAGSIFTLGAGALTSKAVAGLAAAAIVSAGAVAADNVVVVHHPRHARLASSSASARTATTQPIVVSQRSQPVSVMPHRALAAHARALRKAEVTSAAAVKIDATTPAAAPAAPAQAASPTSTAPQPPPTQVTEVTSETTQLPSAPAVPPPQPAEGGAAAPEAAPPAEPAPPSVPPSTTPSGSAAPTTPAAPPAPADEAAPAPPAAPAIPLEVAGAPHQQTSAPAVAPAHLRHQRTTPRAPSQRGSRAELVQGKRLQRSQQHAR
jgi:RNA polymerase sigma factor (sigma-70 family)